MSITISRTHSAEKFRPVKLIRESANGYGEPVWNIELSREFTGKAGGTIESRHQDRFYLRVHSRLC
ncbi:MAG: hypothetical protein R3F51_26725 [Cyanobacteriota/Melainabacteria group bacterium]